MVARYSSSLLLLLILVLTIGIQYGDSVSSAAPKGRPSSGSASTADGKTGGGGGGDNDEVEKEEAIKPNLKIASPLECFTMYDKDVLASKLASNEEDDGASAKKKLLKATKNSFFKRLRSDQEEIDYSKISSRRKSFLKRMQIGLQAERALRQMWKDDVEEQRNELRAEYGQDWTDHGNEIRRKSIEEQEILLEKVFDKAVNEYDADAAEKKKKERVSEVVATTALPTTNEAKGLDYQFVGVVNKKKGAPPTWYARKKPADANWSVRLVHVNQAAIFKDLYDKGKIDIFAKYERTKDIDPESGEFIVKRAYSVKERSWRTMWNYNPLNFFTDNSGMFWRERRLPEGVYTDGVSFYQPSYRYSDGRNGMKKIGSIKVIARSSGNFNLLKDVKKQIQGRRPDIVLEE
mmetsp:Transcript_15011/g.22859  ORF Transcript_15011/g.22859 Transcript_15011/m.22859 type:complete len:405 (+) Transcript_15011:121-1335(+)